MDIVGLTGGIGSGKSTVARMLRDAGVPVVDADVLAREAVAPGTAALNAIRATFGDDVVRADGTLDRAKLGAIVFHDEEKRRALNAIVHPAVAERFAAATAELEAHGHALVVYEVPLLFEGGLDAMMRATFLVDVPPEVQIARVMARDGLDEDAARARMNAQLSREAKRARATAVLDNAGSLDDTRRALAEAWERVLGVPLGPVRATTEAPRTRDGA